MTHIRSYAKHCYHQFASDEAKAWTFLPGAHKENERLVLQRQVRSSPPTCSASGACTTTARGCEGAG